MFEPDETQLKALKTWYLPDNPLHKDPMHPTIKLAGEAGELLDLWGKDRYKPNFSWWDCTFCKEGKDYHEQLKEYGYTDIHAYNPKVLDELGDLSYYLRILAYQQQATFIELTRFCQIPDSADMNVLLSDLNLRAAFALNIYVTDKVIFYSDLVYLTGVFLGVLKMLDCPLERLIELNYSKLNSDETNHGWKDAR